MELYVNQRLMEFLKVKQISVNAISKEISVAQSTLNTQLKGQATLSTRIVGKILEAHPDLSAEWLMRGKGEMLLSGKPEESDGDTDAWKAKYEAIKECYDSLLNCLSGMRELKKPRI